MLLPPRLLARHVVWAATWHPSPAAQQHLDAEQAGERQGGAQTGADASRAGAGRHEARQDALASPWMFCTASTHLISPLNFRAMFYDRCWVEAPAALLCIVPVANGRQARAGAPASTTDLQLTGNGSNPGVQRPGRKRVSTQKPQGCAAWARRPAADALDGCCQLQPSCCRRRRLSRAQPSLLPVAGRGAFPPSSGSCRDAKCRGSSRRGCRGLCKPRP